jgi:colanic acid biosynthesis glycosyl transferase WcaI
MRILILGLNYLPESTSIGPYTAGLAEYLSARGHQVRVITGFPIAPQWKVWSRYKGKVVMREVINGVPIIRTYLYVPKDPRRAFRRILFDSVFAVTALLAAVTCQRPDVVVVISPPLQLAVTGAICAALTGAQVFLHIQDLVPDAAVAVGALPADGAIGRLAYALERFAYRMACGIGVICEGMRRNLLAKGVPESKVTVLPNYIDLSFAAPRPSDNSFRFRLGICRTEFLVMYSGSVAAKQGLQCFVEAGAAFDRLKGITCCVIGEGPFLTDIKETARKLKLQTFRFLPLQSRESLPEQLAAADVLVTTQRRAVRDVVFPGKLIYYMASGRAILAAVSEDSETGRFIREHEVGMVVPPEDPGRLAEAISWLWSHPEERQTFGENGRRIVEKEFNRPVVLERFSQHLEQIGARNR